MGVGQRLSTSLVDSTGLSPKGPEARWVSFPRKRRQMKAMTFKAITVWKKGLMNSLILSFAAVNMNDRRRWTNRVDQ